MHDLTCLNHFSFHEVSYDTFHQSSFPLPARYNFIMYLQKGVAHISSNGNTILLNAGDILHIPRGASYSVKLYGSPEILFGSYAYLNQGETGGATYALQKIPRTARMAELIAKVSEADGVTNASLGYFYLFLHELYKMLTPSLNNKKQTLLELAMNYIVKKPDCKMREVAAHCHVSESGLYALFQKYSSISPASLRLHVKLERAVHYLITTDLPIEEISGLCGFSSSSYFRKKLFAAHGKTPSQIRKNGAGKILGF